MPAHTLKCSRLVLGWALLALAPGCAVDRAASDSSLGASSGGGAAVMPAPLPAPRPVPFASAPVVAPVGVAPGQVAVPGEVRPGPDITVTAGGAMAIAVLPRHGSVALSGGGLAGASARYTPAAGYVGDDQFSLSLGGRRTVTVVLSAGAP